MSYGSSILSSGPREWWLTHWCFQFLVEYVPYREFPDMHCGSGKCHIKDPLVAVRSVSAPLPLYSIGCRINAHELSVLRSKKGSIRHLAVPS